MPELVSLGAGAVAGAAGGGGAGSAGRGRPGAGAIGGVAGRGGAGRFGAGAAAVTAGFTSGFGAEKMYHPPAEAIIATTPATTKLGHRAPRRRAGRGGGPRSDGAEASR